MTSTEHPLTAAQWAELYDRSERTRKRSKRAQVIAILAGILVVGLLVGLGAVYFGGFRDVPTTSERTARLLAKVDGVVEDLHQADVQRASAVRESAKVYATILTLLADGFGTPPAPDASRCRAVQGFRDAAHRIDPSLPTGPPPNGC